MQEFQCIYCSSKLSFRAGRTIRIPDSGSIFRHIFLIRLNRQNLVAKGIETGYLIHYYRCKKIFGSPVDTFVFGHCFKIF